MTTPHPLADVATHPIEDFWDKERTFTARQLRDALEIALAADTGGGYVASAWRLAIAIIAALGDRKLGQPLRGYFKSDASAVAPLDVEALENLLERHEVDCDPEGNMFHTTCDHDEQATSWVREYAAIIAALESRP